MSAKRKRPSHESDAMSLFLSDSVAPELVKELAKHGDFLAAAIALSYKQSPEFWNSLYVDTVYSKAMLEFFKKLKERGLPLRREWLLRIKRFAAKYNETVAAKPCLVLFNTFAGVKAWTVEVPEYATRLIVDVLDENGRKRERFELPVSP